MTLNQEAEPIGPQAHDSGPPCQTCTTFSRISMVMLDSTTGKIIRLYKCQTYGERIWDDDRSSPR